MTQTDLANLALDLLGEPYLTSYDSDTGTTAEAVRLHYPVALKSLLESHPWSFATACSQLTAAPLDETYASITLNPTGDNNDILFTAVTPGPSGNEISIEITTAIGELISVSGNTITINPAKYAMTVSGTLSPDMNGTLTYAGMFGGARFYSTDGQPYNSTGADAPTITDGVYIYRSRELVKIADSEPVGTWVSNTPGASPELSTDWGADGSETGTITITSATATAEQIIDAINAHAAASLLVTAANGTESDGTGTVAAVSATNLAGGSSTSSVYAPAYGSAFNLPDDCVRLLKIDDVDIDAPRNRFEIQGRHLLLEETNAEAPVIHYIAADPAIADWPSTFTDAFVTLLAHRLSAKLCQNDNLKQSLRNDHQLALASAKNKDARETRSRENHGPRQLAARSGLVNARFTRTAQPPYSAS